MHLLFDLDGTLTDPKQGIVACIRHALRSMDVEIAPDIKLESYIGPPLRDTFRSLCGDDSDIEAAVGFYRERFSTIGLFENRVYDDIPLCLKQLRANVDTIHLATSKPAVYAERIINHFGLEQYFDVVYGSELDGRLGDKTELINHILKREKLNAANTVMIGDRSFDVIGARNNNVRAIGVLWGYGSEAELDLAGAHQMCSHPAELSGQLTG
jgi:phosphoglycolate phosphatase